MKNIKQRIKSVFDKLIGKRAEPNNSELAADEVIQKEVFPKKPAKTKSRAAAAKPACKKKPSERTRPTNGNYKMIDPNNDTCDTGKS